MFTGARYQRLLGPAILFLVVVLFHWKLVLTNQYTWMESPDVANMVLPSFQFQAGEWHQFRFPLWDPNGWFGLPLFGQGEPGAAYPLNWLLFLAPTLKLGWMREGVLHWYYVLIHYFAALTAYALARDLGRSRLASILCGCVYALGGYVAFITWPQHLNGAVWTPLVFLYLFRAARGQRPWASAVLSGFFLGFGWLAGHHQMNLFVSIAVAGLWFWLCVRESTLDMRMARLAMGSVAIAIFASGFQTIPLAEYGRLAVRWAGAANPLHLSETVPYSVHQDYALKPLTLLGTFMPNIQQGLNPFIGIVALTLGILGAILAWRNPAVRWLAAISLGGLIFSLGPNSVFHGMLYALFPLVEKSRVPSAGILLFALGIAPLAAFGVDMLPGNKSSESVEWSRCAGWLLAGVAAVLALASLVFSVVRVPGFDDRIMITALCAALAAAMLAGWRAGELSQRAGAVGAVCLVLFELANVTNYNLPNRYVPAQNPFLHRLSEHSDLADYIRKHGLAARVEYDSSEIPYNFGDWYGLETSVAFGASVLDSIWQMDVFSARSKDFFGIRYYLAKTPPRPGLREVFTGRSGVKVFESLSVYPRVWSVHQATTLPSAESIRPAMAAPVFDPLQTVLLSGVTAPDLGACRPSEGEVQMPIHRPNFVRMTANLECRGMVILTDSWYPGWRARVDGESAPIYQVYGGVRGVVVEAGRHVIEMTYRPWSVMLGAMMTALAALVTIVLVRRSS
jgi:hypothetical protein